MKPEKSARPCVQVLIVDDSALVRQVMTAALARERDIVVRVAPDPLFAIEMMRKERPHVLVLDLEMPRMDGLTFLRKIMTDEEPLPVVVCSSFTGPGEQAAIAALREGAVEVVAKPRLGLREFLSDSALFFADAIRAAAQARMQNRALARVTTHSSTGTARKVGVSSRRDAVVAVGASTGGPEALHTLIGSLPADAPGMVVVQHMPAGFTKAFAKSLQEHAAVQVKEAESGDVLARGCVLVAPGDRHMRLVERHARYIVDVSEGPAVSRHRPSVDVLFRSVATCARENAVGILLTGMGDDGAAGMLEMKRAGALTLAQDESTSVVYGMPKAALDLGAVAHVLPLQRLAPHVLGWAARVRRDFP